MTDRQTVSTADYEKLKRESKQYKAMSRELAEINSQLKSKLYNRDWLLKAIGATLIILLLTF